MRGTSPNMAYLATCLRHSAQIAFGGLQIRSGRYATLAFKYGNAIVKGVE